MSVLTRMVTVNPAFLREIKEDNRELHQLLEQTRKAFSEPQVRSISPKQLVHYLGQLRDQLAMHFALEEAYGYFDNAVNVAPRLSIRANQLRSQHKSIFVEICRIVDQAESLLYDETPHPNRRKIALGFERFDAMLRDHESSENDLLTEAFDDDIGVAD